MHKHLAPHLACITRWAVAFTCACLLSGCAPWPALTEVQPGTEAERKVETPHGSFEERISRHPTASDHPDTGGSATPRNDPDTNEYHLKRCLRTYSFNFALLCDCLTQRQLTNTHVFGSYCRR